MTPSIVESDYIVCQGKSKYFKMDIFFYNYISRVTEVYMQAFLSRF